MGIKIIEDRLKNFMHQTKQDEKNALREIAHEIALCALARTDFFKHVAFMGGSCLRIVHGLQRFSEDLDFWTLQPDFQFAWQPYLQAVQQEFKAYAFEMAIVDRAKADDKRKRAFLKKDSIGKVLILKHLRAFENNENLKIKFEIDTSPPIGPGFESNNRNFPSTFSITVLDRPSLFASKVGALFDSSNQKGRHWYDFTWYVHHRWPLNLQLLGNCLKPPMEMTIPLLQQELVKIIEAGMNWKSLMEDVRPFLSPEEQETLNLWNNQFFLGYIDGLEYLKPVPPPLAGPIADGKGKNLIEYVKKALSAGASPDDDSRNGHRPLQIALSNGHEEIARLLIEHGADVNYRDRSGLTPLQAAINHGQFELARLLIKKGAHFNPNAPNLGFYYPNLYQFLKR